MFLTYLFPTLRSQSRLYNLLSTFFSVLLLFVHVSSSSDDSSYSCRCYVTLSESQNVHKHYQKCIVFMILKNQGYLASRTEFCGAQHSCLKCMKLDPSRIATCYGYTCWCVSFVYLTTSSVAQQWLKTKT